MYLEKNNEFYNNFYYNMAGFDVCHNGVDVVEQKNQSDLPNKGIDVTGLIYEYSKVNFKYILKPGIEISYIRKKSVADKAGLKVNDKIVSINGKRAANYKLSEILEILQKNIDEIVVVEVERKQQIIQEELLLKEEI